MAVFHKRFFLLGFLCLEFAAGSVVCASESSFNVKTHEYSLYLDMVWQVSTLDRYGKDVVHPGYPWEEGMMVGCGWVAIKYRGFEIRGDRDIENPEKVEERNTFVIHIPIGQTCDFADYLAAPGSPKKFDVVKWKDNYYLLKE